ncbi:MAG TPA: cytochrome c [Bryobacteraceae bacterium]|jgi:mono/diheme cytochrome c family protein
MRTRTVAAIAITLTVLILAILATSYSFLRSGGLSARKKPGNLEHSVAAHALDLSIPMSAKSAKNPIPPTPEAVTAGMKSFTENCFVCHGSDGAGRTETAKGFSPAVPDLRTPHVQKLTDGQMFYLIKNGIRFTGMPAWNLSEEQIWKLVLVMRQFAKEPVSVQSRNRAHR